MAGLIVALPALGLAQETAPQAAQSGDSVSARLGRLEDKVRDLQVMIGTLEVAVAREARDGAAARGACGRAGQQPWPAHRCARDPDHGAHQPYRADRQADERARGEALSRASARAAAPSAEPPPERQGQLPAPLPESANAAAPPESGDDGDPTKPRWYGPKPGSDELAALLERQAASDPQNLTAALPSGDAQTLYQQGYGALLQKDYAGAEIAFSQLVNAYPNDALASNAQYWLGESYFVRGQYKNAADAFLKGYKKYKSGDKAPDTLLKLGMALAELGQKDAACSTLDELKTKYPQAPEHIGEEAKAWRTKAGC